MVSQFIYNIFCSLCNGAGCSRFLEKNRYEGVRFNILGIIRGDGKCQISGANVLNDPCTLQKGNDQLNNYINSGQQTCGDNVTTVLNQIIILSPTYS